MGDGILFVTYATLRSAGKCGTTRLDQILDWIWCAAQLPLTRHWSERKCRRGIAGPGHPGCQ
nr:strawberry notch family protein [Rhodovulum sulfidophilum]